MKRKANTRSRTTYNSSNCRQVVWSKAKPVRGKNPNSIRKDPYGNIIKYNDYGKNKSTGWQIDHIKPQSRGGSHDISNLQALQTKTNNLKSNSLQKKSRHSQ